MNFGADLTEDNTHFRLWAPKCDEVKIEINGTVEPMQRLADGWHEVSSASARAGSLYQFILPDGLRVPDPASRYQPRDVHGPSEVIDPTAYVWQDRNWCGRPWEETVLYELHVGAFTAEGTFRAAIARLDLLVELGITAIELMPLADFPGSRNWGYDGVLLFAPDSSYGKPDDLKALIDAAHARRLMVFLDVVYNHFGPDGNYLPSYAPIFKDQHTPWGAAVNFDTEGSEIVRAFMIENAFFWISEYHFDGLRLDAVHAISDESQPDLLEAIATRVQDSAHGRHVHLVIENEDNQSARLSRAPDGRPLQYTAQWNDDIHHVLHTAASGETSGYYADYIGDTEGLARALAEGFAYQGEFMPYRGSARGEPSAHLPPTAFIAFIQNHDQIGNRAFGERLIAIAPRKALHALAATYLLAPQIPMLFMGEEWGAAQPFPFFCDFEDDLATAIREGRRAEFAKFPEFKDLEQRERIPDPTARETFLSAKLQWNDIGRGIHAEWRAFYKELLRIRHAEIIPRLKGARSGHYSILGDAAATVTWMLGDGSELILCTNLKAKPVAEFVLPAGRLLLAEGGLHAGELRPWNTLWILREDMRNGCEDTHNG